MSLRGLFVTGTDTGVGKTRISGGIVRTLVGCGRRVGALKPIATSGERTESGGLSTADAVDLREALGDDVPLDRIAPVVFRGDLAPSVAMRRDGRVMGLDEIVETTCRALDWWSGRAEIVVVEGVGGWLCPIAPGATLADLAVALDFPMIVVARRGLGTLNHTLLTVEAIRSRGGRIGGVVLNGSEPTTNSVAEATNPLELSEWLGPVPILADLPFDPSTPARTGLTIAVDWWGLAAPPRLSPASCRPA